MLRAVVDTGVLVSALIKRQSIPGQILGKLRDGHFSILYSTAILIEIIEVLGRPEFREKYHVQADDITALLNLMRLRGELVNPKRALKVCRDPKDDKFLEAAVTGQADAIVSGGTDLIELRAFEKIPILRPVEFLAEL